MKKSKFPYLVLTPMLILLFLFVAVPIAGSFVISFFDYNPLRRGTGDQFIGLQNFVTLFQDEMFHTTLLNTLYYVFVMVGINLCMTLVIAQVLCTLTSNKWRSLFRVNFFMPCVAPLAAVAIVWQRTILPTKGGGLNMLLGLVGAQPMNWTNAAMLMPSLIMLSLWADVGYNIILFIAGIQGIPEDFYEAAHIDGANAVQQFFKLTLPLLGRTLAFVVAMTFISQFQAFAQFSIIAKEGGPGRAGYVLSTYIYNVGFKVKDMGYASAISLALFALIMIVTVAQRRLNRVDWGY
ncbi:MAG: sugar ABC transporter permease [Clostridia bacterium]|nr:sugar ABC transporter permease [Clostridia bacterium]